MQLLKYLNREVIHAMLTVMAILLAIVITNMFVRYLSFAAAGSMSGGMVIKILGIMLPKYIAYLLPVSFFFSVLLTYGKMFANTEITVMFACGLSWVRLLKITMLPAIVIFLFEAVMTVWVLPMMVTNLDLIKKSEATTSGVSLITPGKITSIDGGKKIIYIEDVNSSTNIMKNIFIYTQNNDPGNPAIITAPEGYQESKPDGSQYLILKNGYFYRGLPGTSAFSKGSFKIATQYLSGRIIPAVQQTYESMPLSELFAKDTPEAASEFQWRLAFPLAVLVSTLIAVAVCYIRPRASRYGKVLPAVLLFIVYFNLISVSRTWLANGTVPSWIGIWWVHIIFAVGALAMIRYRNGPLSIKTSDGKLTNA
ncbi:LPS export ABC transporter permease LptF [Francisellaceae bacterium]|nr:LPS export ABC transporter permease LptF [Francisellaceae bacterium]